MIYQFKRPDGILHEGYATVFITNGQATIDPTDAAQVALAKKLGGNPYKPQQKKAQKATQSAKKGD